MGPGTDSNRPTANAGFRVAWWPIAGKLGSRRYEADLEVTDDPGPAADRDHEQHGAGPGRPRSAAATGLRRNLLAGA